MSYIEINKTAYDETAEEYRDRISWYEDSDKEVLGPFISLMKERFEAPNVLELGPGSGLALKIFEEAGFKTSAIDFSAKILQVAKETSPRTEFFEGDFLKYKFRDMNFDGIFAKAFIHLFPIEDAKMVFRKALELLKPNGLFFVSTTVHKESKEGFFEKTDYEKKSVRFRKKWTEEELTSILSEIGFDVLKKIYQGESRVEKEWIVLILSKKNL